jgi:hypothetical protein
MINRINGSPRFVESEGYKILFYFLEFNIGITPRINNGKGKPLPTSRKISNAISKSMTSTPRSSRITYKIFIILILLCILKYDRN